MKIGIPKFIRRSVSRCAIHRLKTSYLLCAATIMISLQGCGLQGSLHKKIESIPLNQEYMFNQMDTHFSNKSLCILSPYQNMVSDRFIDSKSINEELKKINFKANESTTLILYDTENQQLVVENLQGFNVRTINNNTPTTEELHDCGVSNDFVIKKFDSSTVAIFRR